MGFRDIINVIRLDRQAMSALAKSERGVRNAYLTILVASTIGGALATWLDVITGNVDLTTFSTVPAEQSAYLVLGLAVSVLLTIGFTWVAVALYHVWARTLGGRGHVRGLFVVVGHGMALAALSWIPFVGALAVLWSFVVDVNAIAAVERLSTGRALGALAITVAMLAVAVLIVVIILVLLLVLSGNASSFTSTAL